jgi:outer membrane protein TolC
MIPGQRRESLGCLRFVLSLVVTISLGLSNVPGELGAQEIPRTQSEALSADSQQLGALELDVEQAALEAAQTNLLHRLIPQIHLSGSVGLKEILFADPSTALLSYLPRDAYRLNITLSVSEILDDSKHRLAGLRLEKARSELMRLRLRLRDAQSDLQRALASLERAEALDSAELSMKEDVLRFEELRFTHGKIEFDALVRSRLDVVHAKKTLLDRERQITDLRLKLRVQP